MQSAPPSWWPSQRETVGMSTPCLMQRVGFVGLNIRQPAVPAGLGQPTIGSRRSKRRAIVECPFETMRAAPRRGRIVPVKLPPSNVHLPAVFAFRPGGTADKSLAFQRQDPVAGTLSPAGTVDRRSFIPKGKTSAD